MGTYANWNDLISRYPQFETVGGSKVVNSSHIYAAEVEVDERLGPYYTTPFSSNNYTATDLTLELVFIRHYESNKPAWVEKKMERTSMRFDALIAGTSFMVTTSGDSVIPINAGSGAFYSNTKDYHPTHGVGEVTDMHVSSSQLEDEEDARG